MSLASEFKEFAVKGNVVDMAVGIVIGAAFGKIVSSLVEHVIMPSLGWLLSGVNFSDLSVALGDTAGEPVLVKYGAFIQTIIDFVIIAFALFIAIKFINKLKRPPPAAADAPPPPPPRSEVLLEEIRDLLKK